MTKWSGDVTPDKALVEYPRPTLVRKDWASLNGLWDYAVTAKGLEQAPGSYQGRILVPFCIESALSGVMKPLQPDQRLWYRRRFDVPKDWAGRRVLLHFGAVDWETTVTLNGRRLGGHRGGDVIDNHGGIPRKDPNRIGITSENGGCHDIAFIGNDLHNPSGEGLYIGGAGNVPDQNWRGLSVGASPAWRTARIT